MKECLMEMHEYLAQEKGESDLIMRLPTQHIWVLLITQSTMQAAVMFLEKLFQNVPSITDKRGATTRLQLSGCIVEAESKEINMEHIFASGKKFLEEAMKSGPSQMKVLNERD